MPEKKDGYKMHMIVPKPTDPEKLKKREELSNRLKEYPNEELKKALEGVQAKKEQEERERKEEEERKAREVPQEIKDFRKVWEQEKKIIDLDDKTKNKIMEATNRIAPKIKIESDGSRRIEMTIGGKEYKILDVNTETHTDDEYKINYLQFSLDERPEVMLGGMRGDNVDNWKNQKLKEYVKEKQREKFHILKIEEMRSLLNKLGEEAGIIKEGDQIAMLQYLTGMYGRYWLSMRDNKKLHFLQSSRHCLVCRGRHRFGYYKDKSTGASLLMISCD